MPLNLDVIKFAYIPTQSRYGILTHNTWLQKAKQPNVSSSMKSGLPHLYGKDNPPAKRVQKTVLHYCKRNG